MESGLAKYTYSKIQGDKLAAFNKLKRKQRGILVLRDDLNSNGRENANEITKQAEIKVIVIYE